MSIGNNQEYVSLGDELFYVKNYMEIARYRSDKEFELEDLVEDDLRTMQIPKFILQPIVENSVVHGFENDTKNNSILITARIEGETLQISVSDNGCGIRPQKVQELEQAMRDGLSFSRVGILNVSERIRHLYGEQYGIMIKSYEGDGTTVTVSLPICQWEKVS